MIKKCDHPECNKAGVCRAPKSRDNLADYYYFCKEHAAEYNKNWNYFSGMTEKEVEDEWEREVFGASPNNKQSEKDSAEYVKFIDDFLHGRARFDKTPPKKTLSSSVSAALKFLGLPPTATRREVGAAYRALAKKYHPDTAKNKKTAAAEFAKIAEAYAELQKWFNKG